MPTAIARIGSRNVAYFHDESVNPIASYAIGVLAFPVVFPSGNVALAAIAGAGALLIAGAIGLAHSPSADLWLRRAEDTPVAGQQAAAHGGRRMR